MKRITATAVLLFSVIAADQVLAADMPLPSPSPPLEAAPAYSPAPIYDWRGLYVGFNGGYDFGKSSWSDLGNPAGTTGNFDTNGYLLGGTFGGNFQNRALVFGAEFDLDWQSIKGSSLSAFCTGVGATATPPPGAGLSCLTHSSWLGTARARLGYAVDRALFFVTGGGAAGDIRTSLSGLPLQISSGVPGWTAGGGVEIGLAGTWTAKVEYLYVRLGNGTCNVATSCGLDPAIAANDNVKFSESIVRAGINFKFTP